MSCPPCTKDCEQGRRCPAKVARIGARWHGAEPFPPGAWRDKLIGASIGALIVLALLAIVSMFAMVLA
jgi:hypothetical protein